MALESRVVREWLWRFWSAGCTHEHLTLLFSGTHRRSTHQEHSTGQKDIDIHPYTAMARTKLSRSSRITLLLALFCLLALLQVRTFSPSRSTFTVMEDFSTYRKGGFIRRKRREIILTLPLLINPPTTMKKIDDTGSKPNQFLQMRLRPRKVYRSPSPRLPAPNLWRLVQGLWGLHKEVLSRYESGYV